MRTASFPRLLAVVGASALLLLSFACSDMESANSETPAPAPELPANHPAPGASSVIAAGLVFDLPAGFRSVPPESQMRAAQLAIDGSGGEGQVAVFHFGVGGGGEIDANLQRWIGQMGDAGTPQRDSFTVGDLEVVWIDVSGTLLRSTIGSFPPEDMPDYRMFGAVVTGGSGPWFFRAVGPEQTMEQQRSAFIAMLRTAREAA